MYKNEKGFGAVVILLILIILGVVGVAGWLVYDRQQDGKSSNGQTSEQPTQQTDSEAGQGTKISNEFFSIVLPEGWREDASVEAPAGIPEAYFHYLNDDGKSIGVSINSGGFGGGGDGSASFTITGNKIQLDGSYKSCDPATDETGACRYSDGKLDLIVSSESEHRGTNYLFWLKDNTSESNVAYQELAKIINTIEFVVIY